MITEQKLIEKKYCRYNSVHKEFTDFMYQRRFDDKKGKKYFVNFYHYPQHIGDTKLLESWVVEMQIDAGVRFKFEIFSLGDKSIGFVEKKMKLFWETMGRHYYEKC